MVSNALLSSDINLMHFTVLPRIWKLVSGSEYSSVRLEVLVAEAMKYNMSFASRMDGSMNKNGISSLHHFKPPGGVGSLITVCVYVCVCMCEFACTHSG